MSPAVSCLYHKTCSGCSLWDIPFEVQLSTKAERLKQEIDLILKVDTAIHIEPLAPAGLRDYFSLTYNQGRFGFYNKNQTEIIDIGVCLQSSAPLQTFYLEFIKAKPPIEKGSIKLRVFHEGSVFKKGVWLDFANLDIMDLFAEKTYLNFLLSIADEVEIGQRRKKLIKKDEEFKLINNPFNFWFPTFIGEKRYPLFSAISGFSQTGEVAIKKISQIIQDFLKTISGLKGLRIAEYGSGNGSLTLPFFAGVNHVDCYEFDQNTSAALQKTVDHYSFTDSVKIHTGDYQHKKAANEVNFNKTDLIVLNPSRSGIKGFLGTLNSGAKPQNLFYMSCYLKSFLADGLDIQKQGYQLSKVILLDQFPQTDHFEIISFWKLG